MAAAGYHRDHQQRRSACPHHHTLWGYAVSLHECHTRNARDESVILPSLICEFRGFPPSPPKLRELS